MQWTFTQADAQVLYGFIASVLVPFVVAFLKQCHWPDWVKLVVAIGVSILGAVVSQWLAGALNGGSVIIAALGIFTAAQAHFKSWFTALGLDDWLAPGAARD